MRNHTETKREMRKKNINKYVLISIFDLLLLFINIFIKEKWKSYLYLNNGKLPFMLLKAVVTASARVDTFQ